MLGLRSFAHQRMYMGHIEPTLTHLTEAYLVRPDTARPDLTFQDSAKQDSAQRDAVYSHRCRE